MDVERWAMVVGAVVVTIGLLRVTFMVVRKLMHFIDDFNGRPERDQPGVMARLASMEDTIKRIDDRGSANLESRLSEMKGQLDALKGEHR